MSDIIYKYTDSNGSEKILSTNTIRFTCPSELNDPFDVNIDDPLGMEFEEFIKDVPRHLTNFLQENPEAFAEFMNINIEEARRDSLLLKQGGPDRLSALLQATKDVVAKDSILLEMKSGLDKTYAAMMKHFKSYGVFCATKTNINLLMWVHYAENHKGAVFGFRANIEKDSFLRLMEDVNYSSNRPVVFENPFVQLFANPPSIAQMSEEATNRILYTKSTEWQYEEEIRLLMPNEVKNGKTYSALKFYPEELEEVYLGCRMDDKLKVKIIGMAKILNPNVKIYTTKLAKTGYALDFQIVA